MEIKDLLSLFGGLALFLYGMNMMSEGLESAAGDKMQMILEKLTSNRFIGVIVGAVITMVIQSSSATTVMVVGFVNAGLMTLSQAVWIIMGANIGTTVTGQLIALDISAIAPLFAIIGVVMVTFFKNKNIRYIGMIIAGLGILFMGMNMMSASMKPLRNNETFVNMMTKVNNPLIGIIIGAVFTAIIQSSSASIGILQALASSGLITLQNSAFILFGQNIGTCITSFLASLGANRSAKRTTIVHLLFNSIGTVIFVTLCLVTPLIQIVENFTPGMPMNQIANMHTLFNLVTTALLLPFGSKLAELTTVILPIKDYESEESMKPVYLDEQHLGSQAVALSQLKKEIVHMFTVVQKNVTLVFDGFSDVANMRFDKINRREDKINYLNMEITKFMVKISSLELSEAESAKVNSYFKISADLERIGDHVLNLSQYGEMMKNNEIIFTDEQQAELKKMYQILCECFIKLSEKNFFDFEEKYEFIKNDEQRIDEITFALREKQIDRLKKKNVDPKSAVMYSELLTDIERISDHIMNLADECYNSKLSLTFED